MPNNQDFFSPEYMDERLERSTFSRTSGDRAPVDAPTLLVHNLHTLYGNEGAENRRSLQHVWERLAQENTHRQNGTFRAEREAEGRLYALKPHAETIPLIRKVRHERKGKPNPVLTALAALLFLTIMVGSLLALVHFTRLQPSLSATSTPTPSLSTPRPIPGYPYPTPGNTVSVSQPSPAGFSGLTWSPDSKQVAASTQGKVWIWGSLANGQPLIFDPSADNGSVVLAWSPGAPRLAVGSNQVQLIDPGNGVEISHYPALSSFSAGNSAARVTALAWSPDGTRLAVATHDPVSGNTVHIWIVKTGTLVYTFTHQRSGAAITAVSWSSDGRFIASANAQSVQAWNVVSGVVQFQQTVSAATNVAWSPGANNAGWLAFANGSTTGVWDIWSRKMVSSYPDTAGGVLAWAPNGQYLASASGSAVVIWDANIGAHLYTYTGDTHPVDALAWSQDGNYLASGESSPSGANVVRIWSA